ncbi:cytochrome c biogenesis protein CcdA, partial [Streptomyces sp. NPDC088141]
MALVSPCSALLLPAFFAYSIDSTSRLLARTGI